MVAEKYFYKTIVTFAQQQGYTLKALAMICDLQPKTLSKQLMRVDGSDLSLETLTKLRDELAPDFTLDELLPEVYALVEEEQRAVSIT